MAAIGLQVFLEFAKHQVTDHDEQTDDQTPTVSGASKRDSISHDLPDKAIGDDTQTASALVYSVDETTPQSNGHAITKL